MAEILIVAVASELTSGLSISVAFVVVGTWLGVDSTAEDGAKLIQKSKLEKKIEWNICSSCSNSCSSSSTASVISLDSEDSFKEDTDG